MGTAIPARDLRNNYGQIVERVRGGEHITVVSDGIPVVDLVPHVPDVAPPRFRPAEDVPRWTALSDRAAADWAADSRHIDDIDQSTRDPWPAR